MIKLCVNPEIICESGRGSRELNANRRALFANEKRGSVMIFEWLRPSMRLRTFPATTFFGESNAGSAGRVYARPIGTPVNTKTTARHQSGDKLLTFIKDL